MRATTTLLFAAGAAASATQTTGNLTTTVFGNYLMLDGPVASVIAAEPTPGGAVTYLLWCGDDDEGYPCDWPSPGITVTAGPSTISYTWPVDPESVTIPILSGVIACQIEGTTRAVCTHPNDYDQFSGGKLLSRTDTATATAETITGSRMDLMWGPLTITAGLEKLTAAAASGSEATATTAVETSAATSSTTSGTGSSNSSSSSAVVQSTSTSGAAVASRTTDTRISDASNTGTASAAAASSTNGVARFGFSFAAGAAALLVGIIAL